MQSIKARKSKRRHLLVVTLVVFAAVLGVLVYIYMTNGLGPHNLYNDADTKDSTSKNESSKDIDESPTSEEKPTDPTSSSVKNSTSPDENPDTTAPDGLLSISTPYIKGDNFNIRTSLSTVTNSGRCYLTMKRTGGGTYTAQAGVQALPSSSTCKGFDVPMSSLRSGTWTITIKYQNGSVTSTAAKEIVINA